MRNLATALCALGFGLLFLVQRGDAQLFQQQFSSAFGPLQGTSTTPIYLSDANYVSVTPSNSQFTHICATGSSATQGVTISIDGSGALSMDRVSAGNGALIRNFPFGGPPTSLLVKFDFNVTLYRSAGATGANYVNFNVGTSFDTAAGRPSGGFAKFGIGFFRSTGVDSGWYVNNINSGTVTGPTQFKGYRTITFAVNNSGGTLSYTAPGGGSETVADKTWDLWVGTSKEFDDQPAYADTNKLAAFKIVHGSQSGMVAFDNLLIDPLVATGVEEQTTLPERMKLEQNYPNPFNPTTTIRYTVAGGVGQGGTNVRLAVHDLVGREVALLVNEAKAPGSYEVSFEASGLASGVYFCRLNAGGYTEARKLVLMR
jgi:hypothetical protein